jgi:hypothetical protein
MTAHSTMKQIVVVSDSIGLSRAIEVNLKGLKVEVLKITCSPEGGGAKGQVVHRCDLIIVALSSPASEPVVVLARASLAGQVGQVPLLIISDRPFECDPRDQIVHLDFPFDIDQLYGTVSAILGAEPVPLLEPGLSFAERDGSGAGAAPLYPATFDPAT